MSITDTQEINYYRVVNLNDPEFYKDANNSIFDMISNLAGTYDAIAGLQNVGKHTLSF